MNCNGNNNCQTTCGAGATCTQNCSTGTCQLTGTTAVSTTQLCNGASTCQATCVGVTSCKQTAGTGTANCMGCN